ncbi:MAG: hypothetical protein KDE27_08425 [Planctomycetes bacterium]|nr:hypothetical protein [Planctomycetota bacterium]
MNDTQKAIVALLDNGRPELQVAAAQILGELQVKHPTTVRALGAAVHRSPVLGRFALEALARLGNREAFETIVRSMLEEEGLADHAAHLLAEAGGATHTVLAKAYTVAAVEQRARILTILSHALGKDSLPVFVQALLTPEIVEIAAELLIGAKAQFEVEPQNAKLLREGLAKHLADPLPDNCLSAILGVLAEVDRGSSRATFVKFTAAAYPGVVRAAAYRALRGSKLAATQVKAMIQLLEDAGERELHEPVREVLAELPEVPPGLLPVCKRLLAARNPEQRLFALRMLRTTGGAEMAKTCIKLLDHDDARFREAAAAALANNKQAVEPLVRIVQSSKDEELAKAAAGILVQLDSAIAAKAQKTYAEKAVKLMSTNPRAGELLFDVVLTVGGSKVLPVFVEKAVRLRRARRFAEALHILAKLMASPHGTDEARYQLALTRLLADTNADSEDGAPGNATMGFFTTLVRNGFPLMERLRRESSVTPEALLSIATHFAETVGAERRFGTDLLRHLATRNKGRAGDEARVALRAVGG